MKKGTDRSAQISLTHPSEAGYSWTRHIAQIVGGGDWKKVIVAAFTCYFDTSGTQHDQLVLATGGLMSTAEQWGAFEIAWLARLAESNLKYFHRNEIDTRKHPRLLEDLARIARDHSQRKFGMVVLVEKLHRRVPKAVLDQARMDAYSYAGRGCAAHVRQWAKQEKMRTMPELVFATGDKGRGELEERLRKDGFTPKFQPTMDQVNTKTGFIDPGAVPLQAADLLAYELFNPIREMEKKNMRPGTLGRDNLSSVWSILDKIPGEPRVTEEDSIDRFEERVKSFYEKPSGFIKLATWAPK